MKITIYQNKEITMNSSHYQKAIEIIIDSGKISISKLFNELIKLGVEKKEALSIINKLIESPLLKFSSDFIEII